ncbi:pirin family protein [Fusobacterium ulcerans]|jgi:redox-sensitive bicupin YhaK (pirin superfamily)|uniref:pirin family protein n=1 Tax=Fusobacterium ulcerans TaxID=861 RepID=UPI000E550559|nr:pirin family protein [Fusobacterium ulcerans]RGY61279.1 pirin family protein [Fusobacterium ulcerans]
MEIFRPIERILRGAHSHWVGDGFYVKQYFPSGQNIEFFNRFSPFILLDYNEPYYFEATNKTVGVGAHPHRGFETVTLAISGKVEHHDNKGNHGIIGPGDIQWMTAGSGILHKEYHEKEYAQKGRTFHMIQLWVNLPQKYKMVEPKYQSLLNENMGKFSLQDNMGEVTVYAGQVQGVKGPAKTFSPINLYKVTLKKNGTIKLNEPADFNTGALVINGSVKINDNQILEQGSFILFENKEGNIKLEGISDEVSLIFLSGEPLNEPVVAQGPFVMNTEEEIIQANLDFYTGLFGESDF